MAGDTVKPKYPFPNPLEMTQQDPQLALGVYQAQRALTPLERQELQAFVEQLNEKGLDLWNQGKKIQAFEIWFRELRLQQYLGAQSEITALGNIGAVAWENRETSAVRFITERLQQLEQGLPTLTLSPDQRIRIQQSLGRAYEQVRNTALAAGVYGQELERAKQSRDKLTQELALTTLAELYFKDLNYPPAIAYYQKLLAVVRQGQTPASRTFQPPRRSLITQNFAQRITPLDPIEQPLSELEILIQLAYVYGRNQQFADVITTNTAIIQHYEQAGQWAAIPALKAAIADQYQNLQQVDQAMTTWQAVYNQAIALEQYTYAAQALQALAHHYQQQKQLDVALELYQNLLDVELRSDNFVGQMEALDQIGQIYLAQQNYPQAKNIFQQGLAIADRLSYRQDYFAQQLAQASQIR